MVHPSEIARRRPAAWWYALPLALLAVGLCIGGVMLSASAISGERTARPIAGPGESVHFVLEAGVTYTVYQRAAAGEAGTDCTLSPDGNQAEGLRGGWGGRWNGIFMHRPRRVVLDGVRYEYGIQLSDIHRQGIAVSCRGGPILVESGAEIAWPAVIAGATLVLFASAALGAIAWLRRTGRR